MTVSRPTLVLTLGVAIGLGILLAFPEKSADLNERVSRLRYAYRAAAPGALGGNGRMEIVPFSFPQALMGADHQDRIPLDLELQSLALQTRPGLDLAHPFGVRIRLWGIDPTPLRLYFASDGNQAAYLTLDPTGELPRSIEFDNGAPASFGLGFTTQDPSPERHHAGSYYEYSFVFHDEGIEVGDEQGTTTIPLPASLSCSGLLLAPVVSDRLFVVDEFRVEGAASSSTATATFHIRPLLYPLDVETILGDRWLPYLFVSIVLLTILSWLFDRMVRWLGIRFPRVRAEYSIPLLTLPAQFLLLAGVRAAFGLALLSLHVVLCVLVVREIYGLRHVRPSTARCVPAHLRVPSACFVTIVCAASLVHGVWYHGSMGPQIAPTVGLVALGAFAALLCWSYYTSRRVLLVPALAVLLQCLLYVPSRLIQPGAAPIPFYALVFIPWIIALVHRGVASAGGPSATARVGGLLGVVVLALFVEVSIRGDHQQSRFTDVSFLSSRDGSTHLGMLLDLHETIRSRAPDRPSTVQLAGSDHLIDKPPDQFRIVCLGSSTTFGVGVDTYDQSYPGQLDTLLRRDLDPDIRVINGGVAGASLSLLSFYYERVLADLDPDLVILYFGMNSDRPAAARGLARLDSWVERHEGEITPRQIWVAMQLRWSHPWLVGAVSFATNSRSFVWVRNAVENVKEASPREGRSLSPVQSPRATFDEVDRDEGSAWDIVTSCRDVDVPILLVPEVLQNEFDESCMRDPVECGHPYYYVFGHLSERFGQDKVHYASVLSSFPLARRAEYFVDVSHMNQVGYSILAMSVADALLSKGLLDDRPPKGHSGGTASATRK